jgi:hypothetical protein
VVRRPEQGPGDPESLGSDLCKAQVPLAEQQLPGQRRGHRQQWVNRHLVIEQSKLNILFYYCNYLKHFSLNRLVVIFNSGLTIRILEN